MFVPYESPAAYLDRKFRAIAYLRADYFKLNPFDHELSGLTADPRSRVASLVLGGLNLLVAKTLRKSYF